MIELTFQIIGIWLAVAHLMAWVDYHLAPEKDKRADMVRGVLVMTAFNMYLLAKAAILLSAVGAAMAFSYLVGKGVIQWPLF